MFLVYEKDRIISVAIACSVIIILFVMATVIDIDEEKTLYTSTGVNKLLPIYCVNTEENKIALSINCAWSQLP